MSDGPNHRHGRLYSMWEAKRAFPVIRAQVRDKLGDLSADLLTLQGDFIRVELDDFGLHERVTQYVEAFRAGALWRRNNA